MSCSICIFIGSIDRRVRGFCFGSNRLRDTVPRQNNVFTCIFNISKKWFPFSWVKYLWRQVYILYILQLQKLLLLPLCWLLYRFVKIRLWILYCIPPFKAIALPIIGTILRVAFSALKGNINKFTFFSLLHLRARKRSCFF